MKSYLLEISGQSTKDYLWPDTKTPLGHKTAIYQGAGASLVLTVIYAFITLNYLINGVPTPEGLDELIEAGFVEAELYSSLKILFSALALGAALYYIRSIGKKESKLSIYFLLAWTFIEVLSEYSNGISFMFLIFSILFVSSLNCYRAIR